MITLKEALSCWFRANILVAVSLRLSGLTYVSPGIGSLFWRVMSLVCASATAADPLSCCSAMFCVAESIVECFPPFTAA